MAGTKEIKRRIKSVKSTKKITKAMELVAASKMKRAVSATLASRLYAEYSWEVLTSIAKNVEEITHPLFTEREVKNILLVLVTSNRGLCGAYNSQITKRVIALLKNDLEHGGISNNNINIEDINQKIMEGLFVMTMLVDISGYKYPMNKLNASLEKIGKEMGLKIQVQHENIFKMMHRV